MEKLTALPANVVRPHGVRLGADPRGIAWPVAVAELETVLHQQRTVLLDVLGELDGSREGAALWLAAHSFFAGAAALTEVALALAMEETGFSSRIEGPAEIDWLRGISGDVPPNTAAPLEAELATYAALLPRRIARTISINPAARLPLALLPGAALCVSHNELLVDVLKRRSSGTRFIHAETLMQQVRAVASTRERAEDEASRVVSSQVATKMANVLPVPAAMRERTRTLYLRRLAPVLVTALADLEAAHGVIPDVALYSGTGGLYAARLLGLVAMQRGRPVTRFDHGGTAAMLDDKEGADLIELGVSSCFVMPTQSLANLLPRSGRRGFCGITAVLESGHGDPTFRVDTATRPLPDRPRVLYVSSGMLGFRRVMPSNLADIVYLDWQIRVARHLATLPIDLTVRPHPECLLRGALHPVTAIAAQSKGSFDAALAESDVVVYDYLASTTFWKALASNKRVVFLDLGTARCHPEADHAISERCRRIRVAFDDLNRPILPGAELEATVRAAPPADGSRFRRWLACEP